MATEETPLYGSPLEMTKDTSNDTEMTMTMDMDMDMEDHFLAAERLSIRLLQVSTEEEEDFILRQSFALEQPLTFHSTTTAAPFLEHHDLKISHRRSLWAMFALAVTILVGALSLLFLGVTFVGPPNQPVGPYRIIERQEGQDLFQYYTFYQGRDSVGSNGFNTYVSQERAIELGIVNITMEGNVIQNRTTPTSTTTTTMNTTMNTTKPIPFLYMSSAATPKGPRESIRLEGKRRFNRGLFIIDVHHMPTGCGVWPAFWLTDEDNWPVNGEIDIVEGVNFQSMAKTALHSTKGCSMDDVPIGVKTGIWDSAIGIPDKKTGIPDMSIRSATDCFVYNTKQWLNQGCVAVETEGGTLGEPFNTNGGGVYVLEWDPINRHIRSWVFTPQNKIPDNLKDAISTASHPNEEDRVMPDPQSWPLPFGYFAIGDDTSCPSNHFKNMRLVFNLAFCGSVSGNRYQLDCPIQSKIYPTCNDWVGSDPEELKEAYWKVRGVYVYEREWQRAWL